MINWISGGPPTEPGWYLIDDHGTKRVVEVYVNPGNFMGYPNPCGLWAVEPKEYANAHIVAGGDGWDFPLDHLGIFRYTPIYWVPREHWPPFVPGTPKTL